MKRDVETTPIEVVPWQAWHGMRERLAVGMARETGVLTMPDAVWAACPGDRLPTLFLPYYEN